MINEIIMYLIGMSVGYFLGYQQGKLKGLKDCGKILNKLKEEFK